jgi:hypothetical protein
LARAKASLARCWIELCRDAEAEPLIREAHAVLLARFGPDSEQVRVLRERLETIERNASASGGGP